MKKTSIMILPALLLLLVLPFYCAAASADTAAQSAQADAAFAEEIGRLADVLHRMRFLVAAIVISMVLYSLFLIAGLRLLLKKRAAKRKRAILAGTPHPLPKCADFAVACPDSSKAIRVAGMFIGDDTGGALRADDFIADAYYASNPAEKAAQETLPDASAETQAAPIAAPDTADMIQAALIEVPDATPAAEESVFVPDTATGNFFADALRHCTGADIALINCGGIRGALGLDGITEADATQAFPFDDTVTVQGLTETQIRAVLEHSAALLPEQDGRHLYVSGITAELDISLPVGERVVSMTLPDNAIAGGGAEYIVAANDYIANGGDGYDMLAASPCMTEGQTVVQAVLAYQAEGGAAQTAERMQLLNAR